MAKYEGLIVYDWPTSQICLECINSEHIQEPIDGLFEYTYPACVCTVACNENDGVNCPNKEYYVIIKKSGDKND